MNGDSRAASMHGGVKRSMLRIVWNVWVRSFCFFFFFLQSTAKIRIRTIGHLKATVRVGGDAI